MDDKKKRPGGLLGVSIVGILLGALHCGGGVFGIVSLVVQQENPALSEGAQFVARTNEFQAAIRPYSITTSSLGMLVGLLVLALAVGLLALRREALTASKFVLPVGIGFELVQTVFSIWVQAQLMDIMQGAAHEVTGAATSPHVAEAVGQAMSASLWFGMCCAGFFTLAKLAYYGASLWYLRKPETVALFTTPMPLSARGD